MASGTIETGGYKTIALGTVSDLDTRPSQAGTLAVASYGLDALNTPLRGTGFCITATNSDNVNYGRQITISNVGMYSRMLNGGSFESWEQLALVKKSKWTPQMYDYETYRQSLPQQDYVKVGDMSFLFISVDIANISGGIGPFNTMMQIRNCPCKYIGGGTLYHGTSSGAWANLTIQYNDNHYVYPRPNFTDGTLTAGIMSALIIGHD